MKNYGIILVGILFSMSAIGQEFKTELSEVKVSPPQFMVIENPTTIAAGNIYDYLVEHFEYPNEDRFKPQGTTVIGFSITPQGSVTNFKIISSVDHNIDDEIIRVLKSTDKMWKPGMNNGNAVTMEQEVTLAIKTGSSKNMALQKNFVEMAKVQYVKGNKYLYIKHRPRRALRKYNNGVRLLANEKGLLIARGLCYYELGKTEAAINDWERVKKLGGIDMVDVMMTEYKTQKGYNTLASILLEN